MAAAALEWALPKIADGPVLIYSTDQPGEVQAVQAEIGREAAGDMVEQALLKLVACRA